MAILTMLFRKMARNRWLVISLVAGMILCTALTSSMPLYKDAILHRMLMKEMEQEHLKTNHYPGDIEAGLSTTFKQDTSLSNDKLIDKFDSYWENNVVGDDRFSILEYIKERQTMNFNIIPIHLLDGEADMQRSARFITVTGLTDHIKIVEGRLPSSEPVEGVYEALVTKKTLDDFKMILNNEFASLDNKFMQTVMIKPVGVIEPNDPNDMFWNQIFMGKFTKTFILDEELFEKEISEQAKVPLETARWYAFFDYTKFTLNDAKEFVSIGRELEAYYKDFSTLLGIVQPARDILVRYGEKEQRLRTLLWSLNVPLYVLAAFYLYMVSNLLVERQRPEMGVLRSRGASRLQIILISAMESSILAFVAFLAGPYVGAIFTSILGASDSFLSFVDRKALLITISKESFIFAGAAALFALIVNMIPITLATRDNIIDQKRNSVKERSSFWHRFGLDFILLGLALYGLISFKRRMENLISLGLDNTDLTVDPMLFVIPSLFILGSGLLLLRLYPWVVKGIYWIGKSRWSPPLYSSLLLVGRRSGQYQILMLFLIITIGTGIYNASAARTINGNLEDQIWYENGADITLMQLWENDAPARMPGQAPPPPETISYLEPPFDIFEDLPGTERAARVFIKDEVNFSAPKGSGATQLIGINTEEFGNVAWMKDGLLDYHFNEYLNLIALDPYAVLISRTLAEQFNITPGDNLELSWLGSGRAEVKVYGIIDYFPRFNPNETTIVGRVANVKRNNLIVGHLRTIQNDLKVEPYEVWIDVDSSSSRVEMYEALRSIPGIIVNQVDTIDKIIENRNDPFRMAMNGVMSMGFLLSLCITFSGFLLYWVLSIQGRTLQLGIYRAMGISYRQILGMLSTEQLLTSGAGFMIGLITGTVASKVFVPLFQISFDPSQVVPPFEVMIKWVDTLILITFIVVMLGVALTILAYLLKQIKIHQAVKLGED